jgi:hypothetical protein
VIVRNLVRLARENGVRLVLLRPLPVGCREALRVLNGCSPLFRRAGIAAHNPLQWLRLLAVLGRTTQLRAGASYVYPSWLAGDGWTQLER